jgi:membrane carboxypeptidase/penicillin-binding protein
MYDVVYVKVTESSTYRDQSGREVSGRTRVELRVRPTVQGIAVVLENRTGRVLAMAGGFSYPLSQLNRVTQSRRQPGSSFKPMTYLMALNSGLQPNTLVDDAPITYPPIGGATRYSRPEDYWSPRNYDGGYSGTMTMRRALEHSKNLATARLLDGGIASEPARASTRICKLAIEAQVYPKCERYYPFVLGAQPVRPIDLAAFYAAIANEGKRPTPHVIEQITQDGREVYKANESFTPLARSIRRRCSSSARCCRAWWRRGTAARLSSLSAFIGGKTGTSDDFNDAWFAGFSNDVTDRGLGRLRQRQGQAHAWPSARPVGKVALPIFESIMKAAWATYAPQTPLPRPSPEAARRLIALPIDVHSGQRLDSRGGDTRFDVRGAGTPRQRRVHGIFPAR